MKFLKSKTLWTLCAIFLSLWVGIALLPKPIDMDLEKVGKGKKAVVFVYDYGLAISNPQTIEMNKAREMLGDNITFLIAKTGNPEAEKFMRRYNASAPELLFFDGNGKIFDREFAVIKAEEIIEKSKK